MNETLPLLRLAAERTSTLVRSLSDDQLALPTPCSEYDVKELLNHLEWAMSGFESLAGGGGFPPPKEYTGDFPERAERALKAWDRPQAWEGTSEALHGLPMIMIAKMFLVDVVVHAWDLSKSVGRPFEVDDETVAAILAFAEESAPMRKGSAAFGDPVEVPADAPAFDRAVGLLGRDPAWTP
ncbi:TIGR03086 family metal-binding protein [Nonomuraea purpurea]|uniref:TIGR03086 family metal-binding protein n=1 Tax=Nonomuraea purpurea TaxID=1849276 RepID=A0ABV8FZU5_9ACTN